jgi:ATP-dependent DNA helicase RecQ
VSSRPKSRRDEAERSASLPLTPAQKDLEKRLRDWRKAEATKTGKPAFIVFSDAVLANIVQAQPTTLTELQRVSGIGPEKADRYGAAVISLCRGETQVEFPSQPSPQPSSRPKRAARSGETPVFRPSHHSLATEATPATLAPAEPLTPDQQALDTRLRAWRASEAERLGLPQFFVLGTATLRSIAVERPRTLTELKMIDGISIEKAEKFGPSILEVCTAR